MRHPSITKAALIHRLNLQPHREGGYFVETYQSKETVRTDREGQERKLSTSIFYLLTDDQPQGRLHRNQSDIVHYFHLGGPIEYLTVSPSGEETRQVMGFDVEKGQLLQMTVPGGYWKSSRLLSGEFGLISESVAPGFDYRDMEMKSGQ